VIRPRRLLLPSGLVLVTLLVAGCSPSASGKSEGNAAKAARPPVAVETARLAPTNLEDSVEVVGTLEAKNAAEVKTEYSGNIAEVFVTEWVRVARGTPLARLDTREAEASVQAYRATLLQAEAASGRTARELERALKLKEAGLATQQALDDARTLDEAARGALASGRAQLALSQTKLEKAVLRSPIDGVVASRNVSVGDYVENMGNPKPIFRIVDNRVLEVTVTVPSARFAALRVGQPLTFTTDGLAGKEFRGTVSYINPAADEASRTVKVKAEVPNVPEVLKTGLFVKGRIVTGNRPGVIAVPRSAFQSWDTAARKGAVFVVEASVARRREVETGTTPGELVEVTKGIVAGEEIVTAGAFQLKDGDRVTAAGVKG